MIKKLKLVNVDTCQCLYVSITGVSQKQCGFRVIVPECCTYTVYLDFVYLYRAKVASLLVTVFHDRMDYLTR